MKTLSKILGVVVVWACAEVVHQLFGINYGYYFAILATLGLLWV